MYTYANVKSIAETRVNGQISDANWLLIINSAARAVYSDLDLRSGKRKSSLSPFLFDDVYDYSVPTDLKGISLIDIKPQVNREANYKFTLTTPEEFDRKKSTEDNLCAFTDDSFTRKLKISAEIDDDTLIVSTLDSTSANGGTWAGYGDGENLTADSDYYVKGSASINWDINADGGTTAGIYNDDINTFDITDYVSNGAVFVWAYLSDKTDVTNFIIRIGSSASAYYTKTVTATNEGTSFVNGWNLLRFDFSTATQVGTVDLDACNYCAVYMTKDAGKTSETDYRFDHIMIKRGEYHDVIYYSLYPFQSSVGTWKIESDDTTDYLNVSSDELEIVLAKITELGEQYLGDDKREDRAREKYNELKENYKLDNPSEKMLLMTGNI